METYIIRVSDSSIYYKNWFYEDANRFVFEFPNGKFMESSCFIHFDKKHKAQDLTIEILTIHGCPLSCL